MLTERGFPHSDYPTGWYQVAWSGELDHGAVLRKRYFGRELVLFRTEGGTAALLDAYCPHLGAHLGFGGTVDGEDIVCPFHGWKWDTSGANVDVPYSEKLCQSRTIESWHVEETNGMVYAWYDADAGEPTWSVPTLPEWSSGDYYDPFSNEMYRHWEGVALHPQFITENAVDPAHQKYVHGSTDVGVIESFEAHEHTFRVSQSMIFGKNKGSTWLTPDGEVRAYLDAEVWGMGTAVARFAGTDDAAHVQSQTPIDQHTSDLRVTVFVPKDSPDSVEPSEKARKRMEFQWRQVDNDLVIWENMKYIERAPLAREEAKPYAAFRKWAEQFYPKQGASA